MRFELGFGINTWEDLKTAIAVYQWLQSMKSYVELQQFLMDRIIEALRRMKQTIEWPPKKEASEDNDEPK